MNELAALTDEEIEQAIAFLAPEVERLRAQYAIRTRDRPEHDLDWLRAERDDYAAELAAYESEWQRRHPTPAGLFATLPMPLRA